MEQNMMIFSLSANVELTRQVCSLLSIPMGKVEISCFADGELLPRSLDNVKGKRIYLIQSIYHPVNERLMETLLFIDGIRRAGCGEITFIVPYLGYARQNEIDKANEPISAEVVANFFNISGLHEIWTVELHTPKVRDFFHLPFRHFSSCELFAQYFKEQVKKETEDVKDYAVVAPDEGARERASKLCSLTGIPHLVTLQKFRPSPNQAKIVFAKGDVKGKTCIIMDDIIDTGGTILAGAQYLMEQGAKGIIVFAAHGLFNQGAMEKLQESPCIQQVVITDSVLVENQEKYSKLHQLSLAPLFAKAIQEE